ncbi:A-kinase anchor protein 1, mitochondrial [Sceloporus undulatus]|uniref:A-kinase anchor protein 1, mitochondrial n=1 Tax=Sceloporus undulatus TaxID=8520 RepID=UPI001C4D7F8E|nr:A-kinase anchor protein 1, mitochondrial [Sceloporus undulatus]XP_042298722.1 A-kinase anchor protein 1, mitochondrial [Sceloporus undulatus]
MALRLRTLLPFAIPGVLALIGWWWFSSRKKERASNHDRQDAASLEEHRICSAKKESCTREDPQSNNELLLPLEAKQPPQSTLVFQPLVEVPAPSSPEPQAWCLDPSKRDLPVPPKTAVNFDALRDESEKLKASMGCRGMFASHALESSFSDSQKANVSAVESTAEGKVDSTQVADQVPLATFMTTLLAESFRLEKSGHNSEEPIDQNNSKEGRYPEVAVSTGSSPIPCSVVAHEAVPEATLDVTETEEMNGGVVVEVETAGTGLPASLRAEPAGSRLSEEVETSSSNAGSMLKHPGFGDGGQKGSLEKERIGGITLDKEEVEKIEQVAIHIISNVIRAATEEVLSGSVNDVSDRICQMASRVDKPMRTSGVGSEESSLMSECAAEKVATVELSPLLEENIGHPTFSSHLTHGLLANPAHAQPRDSVCTVQPPSDPAVAADHEEEFEDIHTVTEDSGCSACASEDGTSAEDLLRPPLSPALRQTLDLLNMPTLKDLEQNSASSQKPSSPTLAENKVPYSNGVLKEDGAPLGHEQTWPGEADGDHSGGSDVNSMDSVDSGCALRKNGSCQNAKTGADSNKTELIIWEIEIPKHLVGRLIGKQGRSVSFLKQVSGAKIYISTVPYTQDFQICHIEGSQQNVDKALSLIGKKFKDLSLTNIYSPPPPSLPLHSLPMTSWLMLPDGVTVEVIVVNQVNAGHLFVQQHTHPTFHVLRSLDQQMYLCYSQPGIPTMPTPVEVGVVCAAPGVEGAWWRAQVVGYFKDTGEVEIRYVDYGGYERVKIDTLRQIRSDFVTLPFQGAEVLLDNVVPLPDDDHFSSEADAAVSEMTRGTPLLAQVTNYDNATGLPLIQLWSMLGDELVSINRTLVERGFAQWVEGY